MSILFAYCECILWHNITNCDSQVHINDSHYQMVIHWEGEDSKVIVALTRDISPGNLSTSQVYISYDYGASFTSATEKLKLNNATDSLIHMYYNSPAYNSHVCMQVHFL
jgi:hypothetical protein